MKNPDPHINVEDRADYAYFRLHGPFERQSTSAQFSAAMQECLRLGRRRALIDGRELVGDLDFFGRYSLASELGMSWDRTIRLAVLIRPDRMDPQRIAERVATNRGVPGKIFTHPAEAAKWIMSEIE